MWKPFGNVDSYKNSTYIYIASKNFQTHKKKKKEKKEEERDAKYYNSIKHSFNNANVTFLTNP
jgi:hypothetical protein